MKIDIPHDILNVMVQFHNTNKVYSVGYGSRGAHGHQDLQIKEWTEIDGLKDKQIEKIKVGEYHSYFLDSTGIALSAGRNNEG